MNEVYIEAYDEKHAPPSQPVLRLSKVGDEVFVAVCEKEENHEEARYKVLAETAVSLSDLARAVYGAGLIDTLDTQTLT